MTGTLTRRARQMIAVVVLSLLIASLPATAWADHGDRGRGNSGRDGHSSAERRGDRDHRSARDDRPRTDGKVDRPGARGHADAGNHGRNEHRPKVERGNARRSDAPHKRDAAHKDVRGPARHLEPPKGRSGAGKDDGGFVTAASVQPGAGDGDDRRAEQRAARQQAERDRQDARRERAARGNRLELDRVIRGASTTAPRQADQLERDLRRWFEQPAADSAPVSRVTPDESQVDEPGVAATATAPPSPPSPQAQAGVALATVTAAPEPPTAATPSTPPADVLAHERGAVDRTFRAGGTLLRDTGRAVFAAIPPQTRSFSIPLGLLVALAGYLVVQRRFRPGALPMSAAALPEQEGARERHRL